VYVLFEHPSTFDALLPLRLLRFRARSVHLNEAARSRLGACSDVDAFTRWVTRAVRASSETDVFGQDDA
jgi:hypothetical protein